MTGKKIALFVVAMLMIAVIGSTFYLSKSQEVMTKAQSVIGEELSKALGSVVTVGQVEITSYNTIAVHDLTIYDKQAQPVLASEKIILTYHPLSILRGQAIASAISDMSVEKPTLWLTQKSGGQWNVQDLLQEDPASKSSFSSKITLVDGKALLKTAGALWTIENINGSLDFADNPAIGLRLQGVHKGESIKVNGSVDSQGRSAVTLIAKQLFIADYQAFLSEEPLGLVGGSLKNVELTVIRDKSNLEWTGTTELADVDLDIDKIKVRKAHGNMIFTNKNMYVFASGNVFDQPVQVRGSIQTAASQPVLNLVLSSAGFDPSVVTGEIPLKGKVAFEAKVTGTAASPIIAGDVSLATGDILGYTVHNAHANLYIANKKITINQLSGDMLSGSVNLAGWVDPEVGSYDLSLKGHQIAMENFAEYLPDSQGRGDVDVRINGVGSFQNAEVKGTASIGEGRIAGVDVSSLGVGFYRHNGTIVIDYANIGIGQGLVTASGKIEQENLKLTAYGLGMPLQGLDKQGTGLVAGNGDFVAQIGGSLSQPECTLDFTATNGQLFQQNFQQAKGIIYFNRQQVVVKDIDMIDGVTTHKAQGTIELQGQQAINLAIHSKKARAENIIKLLVPDEKLTGNVDNEMLLTGTLDNINATGKICLTDGSFRGRLIAKAQGSYQREQGVTTISDFSIDSLNTQVKLAGRITATNDLDFDVTAQDIDLEKLNLKLSYPVSGRVQFAGKLTGTPSAPIFTGEFATNSIKINNQEITGVTGKVALTDNEIEIPYLSFMQGTGKFNAAGGFVMDSSEIYGSFDVENAELSSILGMTKLPHKDICGKLNGHIRINGKANQPDMWLTGNLKDGRIKKYPVGSINIDVALENNVLKINELTATQGAGVLMARGTADLNGPLDVEIGGRDIDAGLVTALLDAKIEPKGTMGFAAQVSGTATNPHTAMSLEIANGGIGDATFDSLYGLLILEKDMIHVNQVLLKKGPYRASAYGVIPVAALSPDGRERGDVADQMDLKVRLDEADLSILPLLTKEVSWAQGPTRGEINVTGTLKQPLVTGQIAINNGIIKLTNVTSPIEKVGVDITFEGDTINVKKFDGHLGQGLYSLTGTAKLRGMKVDDYDFSLLLDKPEIKSKYFTGAVDGSLNFSNRNTKNNKPKLAGKILFENDIINIPVIPDMEPSGLDIDLDVEMRVGKKVRFYNPYLYDIIAQGRVKFAGSTLEPDFTGYIGAVRGTVKYLRTQFKVNEASVSFKKFASLEPIVKLNAQTMLQQITVNLDVNGPISGLKFSLTSDPAMKQQEILSLLTLRSRYLDKQNNTSNGGMGRDELVSALGAGLQMQFMGDVEGTFRSALGLDEFRVVQDTTSDIVKKKYADREEKTTTSQEVYNIEMSKYLTEKVLLTYTMGINYDKKDLGLRYALSRRTSLNASVDEKGRTWFGLEARFRF